MFARARARDSWLVVMGLLSPSWLDTLSGKWVASVALLYLTALNL
jgi:hypothetical protein